MIYASNMVYANPHFTVKSICTCSITKKPCLSLKTSQNITENINPVTKEVYLKIRALELQVL